MHKDFKVETGLSRRSFLQTSLAASGALVFAFHLPGLGGGRKGFAAEAASADQKYPPQSFIRVEADGTTVFQINKLEMGQGVNTSMAQILAFYDAILPLADQALAHIERFPLDQLPDDAARLMRLLLALTQAAIAVEYHGQPRAAFTPYPHALQIANGMSPWG